MFFLFWVISTVDRRSRGLRNFLLGWESLWEKEQVLAPQAACGSCAQSLVVTGKVKVKKPSFPDEAIHHLSWKQLLPSFSIILFLLQRNAFYNF